MATIILEVPNGSECKGCPKMSVKTKDGNLTCDVFSNKVIAKIGVEPLTKLVECFKSNREYWERIGESQKEARV